MTSSDQMSWLYSIIGEFGPYQRWIFFLLCVPSFLNGMPNVLSSFVSRELKHRCYIPGCDDDESKYNEDFLNFTIPSRKNEWDSCNRYATVPNAPIDTCRPENFNTSIVVNCTQWVYDKSMFTATLVTEFDLICSKRWYAPMDTSSYMMGMLVGAFLSGIIADYYGRRKGLLISSSVAATASVAAAFMPSFMAFVIFRFLSGLGTSGLFKIGFLASMEFVGLKWRTFCGILINVPFALGEATVGLMAYLIRDFRYLQLACTAPIFIMITYSCFMPESIRWLLTQNRTEEAVALAKKVTMKNGLKIPNDLEAKMKSEKIRESSLTILDIFRYKNIRRRTFVLYYCWMTLGLIYYGISLSSSNLSGNIFINFSLTMFVEIPGYLLAYFTLDRCGRKGMMIFLYLFGGAVCIIAGFLPKDFEVTILIFSLFGKFSISAVYSAAFVATAELYPTELRGIGVFTCSVASRVGAILAPFISNLAKWYLQLPILIFGFFSSSAGLLVTILPETAGFELPQTIEECEHFGLDQPVFCQSCCIGKRRSFQVKSGQ